MKARRRAAATIATNAYRLALSRNEQQLFVSSTDGNVYVVNPATLSVTTARPAIATLRNSIMNGLLN